MANPDQFERIARRIGQYRDEMVDLQIRLTAIPAIAPGSGGRARRPRPSS